MALFFPQEIIDTIIDELQFSSPSSHRHRNLSCCSLVCRSFLSRCRKHLFSSIVLASDGHHSWNEFHDRVFKGSPEIMLMIHSVVLSSGDGHDKILCTLLTAMCNLRHVELAFGFQPRRSRVLNALRFHKRTIISLRFADVTFQSSAAFFDFLAALPELRSLMIKDLDYEENMGIYPAQRDNKGRSCRLENFYFHASSYTRTGAFRKLIDHRDIVPSRNLRRCGVSLWDGDDLLRAKRFLNDSLDCLHLIYNTQLNLCDILDILDFNLFNLPHLSITTFLPPNFRYTDMDEFERGVRRCVLLDGQLALEELTLRLYPNLESCATHSLWRVLDASLSSPCFPRFQHLEVELIYSTDRGLTDDGGMTSQTIGEQFSALKGRDGVRFSCRYSDGDFDDSRFDISHGLLS
ncbi:uncharacterized protein BT62DRAFT_925971 [Guyanagaster necrorhizus]|uniref:F-box domain-containing protein n=1 Tax=Guyanagaster necrorhizus TaxID=856835 RepID=A0A9P8AY16_9AGAR|nr:uncharacterized protein BT62DRAFT_925971 [Guyanagaster necrorhizus MCA 3950]KAG7451791.1 hypothetical protein BT62DRAFT_925971 [Guyanagaster necrorhizus MCA 3950]